jgi:hypothetical protein
MKGGRRSVWGVSWSYADASNGIELSNTLCHGHCDGDRCGADSSPLSSAIGRGGSEFCSGSCTSDSPLRPLGCVIVAGNVDDRTARRRGASSGLHTDTHRHVCGGCSRLPFGVVGGNQPRIAVPRRGLGGLRVVKQRRGVEGARAATRRSVDVWSAASGNTHSCPEMSSAAASSSVLARVLEPGRPARSRTARRLRESGPRTVSHATRTDLHYSVWQARSRAVQPALDLRWSPHRLGEGAPLVATPGVRAVLDEHSSDGPLRPWGLAARRRSLGTRTRPPITRADVPSRQAQRRGAAVGGRSRGLVPGCGRRSRAHGRSLSGFQPRSRLLPSGDRAGKPVGSR